MQPRQIRPATMHFITVAAVRHMFLLRPDPGLGPDFEYILAVAAERFGILLHEFFFHVNHFHLLVTDVHGQLPDFMHFLDSVLARYLNARYGGRGKVFETYHSEEVLDGGAAFTQAVYTLVNPVKDCLVTRTSHWRGASSRSLRYDEPVERTRPRRALWALNSALDELGNKKRRKPIALGRAAHRGKPSQMPATAALVLSRPPARPELSGAELRSEVLRALWERENSYAVERSANGTRVMGMDAVLKRSRHAMPERPADLMATVPEVAGDPERKEARRAELRAFRREYAAARAAFLSGVRDVVWPEGTWLMRVRHGLPCAAGPPR